MIVTENIYVKGLWNVIFRLNIWIEACTCEDEHIYIFTFMSSKRSIIHTEYSPVGGGGEVVRRPWLKGDGWWWEDMLASFRKLWLGFIKVLLFPIIEPKPSWRSTSCKLLFNSNLFKVPKYMQLRPCLDPT